MRKISLLTISAILLAALAPRPGAAAPAPVAAPGNHDEAIQFGGLTREFVVHVPPRDGGKSKLPLVIMLHGAGGSGPQAAVETGWPAKADREGFIAVFPNGVPAAPHLPASFRLNPQLWNDGSGRGAIGRNNIDDVRFLDKTIDYVEAHYAIDPARIYLTGFSNGASMTWYAGERLSDRIAAIAPVSGHLWVTGGALKYPVPVLFIIGTADPLNPIGGGDVKLPWFTTQHNPPIDESLKEWERMLACGPQVETARDRNGVREVVYDHCERGGEVAYYTIEGLGHVWPGGKNRLPEKWVGKPSDKLNATDVIWAFFKAHPRTAVTRPTDSAPRATR